MLEAHGEGQHLCAFREILKRAPRQHTLAAPEPLAPDDSRYAAMLRHLDHERKLVSTPT